MKITRGDPSLADAFRIQLVDWYLHDDIAAIPPK
jgi:hypothetical protein